MDLLAKVAEIDILKRRWVRKVWLIFRGFLPLGEEKHEEGETDSPRRGETFGRIPARDAIGTAEDVARELSPEGES
jgi:hypothetical protein